jgi:6-phosphogluconolactonase (cycloisomerase 2 family)
MSNQFAGMVGIIVLISLGLLVACGTAYNSSTDGLVLVGSQGSSLIQTFSFGLNDGHMATVSNPTSDTGSLTCVLPGLPASIVLDPAGAYAYAIINSDDTCTSTQTGIQSFKVNSDGTITAGAVTTDPNGPTANPTALSLDTAGKFLYVTEGTNGIIDVYSVSSGTLNLVSTSPALPPQVQQPNLVALALSPMIFPAAVNGVQVAECTNQPPPTTEYLYAVDNVNYLVWQFVVNPSTGALSPNAATMTPVTTGPVPAGVAVDPCNRFAFVSDSLSNKISAYTICNGSGTQSPTCVSQPLPPGALVQISTSPVTMPNGANGPGPLVADPYGNYVYVLDLLSNQVSVFRISPVSGGLTPGNPATVSTGLGPTALAVRSDDSWLFVTNFQAATLSQFSITGETGALNAAPVTDTDNQPYGVAVK